MIKLIDVEKDLVKYLMELGLEHDKANLVSRNLYFKRMEIKSGFRYLFSIGMVTNLTFEEYKNGLSIEQCKDIFGIRNVRYSDILVKYL